LHTFYIKAQKRSLKHINCKPKLTNHYSPKATPVNIQKNSRKIHQKKACHQIHNKIRKMSQKIPRKLVTNLKTKPNRSQFTTNNNKPFIIIFATSTQNRPIEEAGEKGRD
jgi:hypothetical protein